MTLAFLKSGKFTCLGPGRSIYVPTGTLHAGANEVVVFEMDAIGVKLGGRSPVPTITSVAMGPLWVPS